MVINYFYIYMLLIITLLYYLVLVYYIDYTLALDSGARWSFTRPPPQYQKWGCSMFQPPQHLGNSATYKQFTDWELVTY